MTFFRKSILTLLSFLVIFSSSLSSFLVSRVAAQETNPWYSQSFNQWYTKVYDTDTSPPQEIFGERYTAAQVQWVMYSLLSFLINSSTLTHNITCIFLRNDVNACLNEGGGVVNKVEPAILADVSPLQAMFSDDRSFSGVNYIRNAYTQLSLIPSAQAQVGFGFQALNPIQNIWRVFRDIMYGLFVVIIIVFAFMIMFRVKINPQTVVSIQSSIPKIVITLIFVTFSYAIAGLLVDLMYVLIGLVALVFAQTGLFQSPNPWLSIFKLLTDGPHSGTVTTGIISWIGLFWKSIWPGLSGAVTSLSILPGLQAIAFILQYFLMAGIGVWMILNIFKIVILLIKTYISILVSIIFSPLLIGFGAVLPSGGFSSWIKSMTSNLLVYPVTGVMLLLSTLFLSGTYPAVREQLVEEMAGAGITNIVDIFNTGSNSSYWYPPLTLGMQDQATGWDPLPILWVFASIGILAMIPKVSDIIKALMSGKPIESAGVGEAANAIFAGGLGYAAGAAKGLGRSAKGSFERNVIAPKVYSAGKRLMEQDYKGTRWDKWISSYGLRRGWIQQASPEKGQIQYTGRILPTNRANPNNPPKGGQ